MPLVEKVGYAASSALVYEFKSVRVTQAYVYVHFCVRLAGTRRCICASHMPCAIVCLDYSFILLLHFCIRQDERLWQMS